MMATTRIITSGTCLFRSRFEPESGSELLDLFILRITLALFMSLINGLNRHGAASVKHYSHAPLIIIAPFRVFSRR